MVDGLSVYADPMLEKVFHNLVDNSIRHGKDTREIRLYCDTDQEGLKLVYTDDGVGIAQVDKGRLFQGDIGHGLLLARDILAITEMGINETGFPGEGAKFEITIPQGNYRMA